MVAQPKKRLAGLSEEIHSSLAEPTAFAAIACLAATGKPMKVVDISSILLPLNEKLQLKHLDVSRSEKDQIRMFRGSVANRLNDILTAQEKGSLEKHGCIIEKRTLGNPGNRVTFFVLTDAGKEFYDRHESSLSEFVSLIEDGVKQSSICEASVNWSALIEKSTICRASRRNPGTMR